MTVLSIVAGSKIWVNPNGMALHLAKTPLDKKQQVTVLKTQRVQDHIAMEVNTEQGNKLVFAHKNDLWIL